MKHLTILRHAKAEPFEDYTDDFQRPLAEKGIRQIHRIARVLRSTKPPVDWLISSPALRAQETAEQVAELLDFAHPIHWDERIYEATAPTLLAVLQEAPEAMEHVLLVGHNPGLERLISGLCSGEDGRLALRLRTAGLAYLRLDIYHWNQLRWGAGELQYLIAPRFLKR